MYFICDNQEKLFLGKNGKLTTESTDVMLFSSKEDAVFCLLLLDENINADLFVCQK